MGARAQRAALPLARRLEHDLDGRRVALGEGEDYELLASLRPAHARRALEDPVLRRAGLHVIGDVVAGQDLVWEVDGQPIDPGATGWSYRWS
ncbi:MAG: hypothetical protein H8E31_09765 [Planctomycetes bacterium]|nr:hypothetical protein [Planctomycetota bacterium]